MWTSLSGYNTVRCDDLYCKLACFANAVQSFRTVQLALNLARFQHADGPIFSIDVHPSGLKLLTAGADKAIRVWNFSPILHEKSELDSNVPKLLATLQEHYAAVNVARFSPNGNFIASGSDDQLAAIYELKPGPGKSAFGSNATPNVENWKQVQVLRGHKNNIVDLTWSPDSLRIATASLDNYVNVWDVSTGQTVARLQGHYGFVKGVSWDPFNHYLASQGEQDGVIIWRVEDWHLVAKFDENLKDVGSVAFHHRLGWSPDGQYVTAAAAFDKPQYTAPLIKRNDWKSSHCFVGHKNVVSVVKYNPKLFFPRKACDGAMHGLHGSTCRPAWRMGVHGASGCMATCTSWCLAECRAQHGIAVLACMAHMGRSIDLTISPSMQVTDPQIYCFVMRGSVMEISLLHDGSCNQQHGCMGGMLHGMGWGGAGGGYHSTQHSSNSAHWGAVAIHQPPW